MTDKPVIPPPAPAGSASIGLSILIFGFGAAAGLLVAFSGLGFMENSAALIVTVFLIALCIVSLIGLALVLLRRPLWRKVFGVAEAQLEMFASPLARVAESALDRNPGGATAAARDLVQLVLARYSWLTARRWIITALTALIAAMAALAGTALLFKQNQLIAVQSDLLVEQNAKLQEQTTLAAQSVQLAEAARNAALAVEITQIAALVGDAAKAARSDREAALGANAGDPLDQMVNVLDPIRLDQGLVLRIVSASRATRPYRFLDIGLSADNDTDKTRVAMARRTDLPNTNARMAAAYGWAEQGAENRLIDRPASPERGQLLQVLVAGGIRNLEVLNHFGLDLSFAYLQAADLFLLTTQGGRLSYADFSGSHIMGGDFGGSYLENSRFRSTRIQDTSFAAVTAERVHAPLKAENAPYGTFLIGADFASSVLIDIDFTKAYLTAANLDAALLVRPNFTGASLGAATLRNAVLLAPTVTGTDWKSADLDGAVVFGATFLADAAALATPDTLRPDIYEATAMTLAEVMAINIVYLTLTEAEVTEITKSAPAFRLKRIAAFTD
jgi:uncharacterized protein YjbI with pentapeptide repeats